jgi:hypothetical protein
MPDTAENAHDRYLEAIVSTLGLFIQDGELVDKHDFEHVKRQNIENANERDVPGIESITWDEVRGRLWD